MREEKNSDASFTSIVKGKTTFFRVIFDGKLVNIKKIFSSEANLRVNERQKYVSIHAIEKRHPEV